MPPRRPESTGFPRLPGLEPARLRAGYYSDAYFLNAARALRLAARAGETFPGAGPALRRPAGARPRFKPGDAEVEMQFFARRRPRFVAAGIGIALRTLVDGALGEAAGRGRGRRLQARAVPEGSLVRPRDPVLSVRARYRDIAHLETPLLGILTRASRVATNVYEALVAARGKPILFFPARFDAPCTQPLDGYAYRLALEIYRRRTGRRVVPYISTDAQGALWRGRGVGTVPHAYILCFLGDTAGALLSFCRHIPPAVRRVALVDTTNDCVGESVRTARRLFEAHLACLRAGRTGEAERYRLFGVRADTAEDLRDRSVPRSRDVRLERGVTPVLIRMIRQELDRLGAALPVPSRFRGAAEDFFRGIRIVASGGFDPDRIRVFEGRRAPVDIYGIGSYFLRGAACDYTADVVRVKVGGLYRPAAKAGRGPRASRLLRPVRLP